jgi:hypothetical protein
MKHISNFTAALLGIAFVVFGANFFLKFMPVPMPPEGTPAAMFLGAMFTSGFLAFVKVLEIVGGFLIFVPATRNFGLLVLGPIVVNIVAFNFFFFGPTALLQPPVLGVAVLMLIQLLFAYRAVLNFISVRS